MDTLQNIEKDKAFLFFQEIVEPTVADFLNKPDNKRLGLLACLCLSHVADHIFYAWPEIKQQRSCQTASSFRSFLMDQNFALKQIFDVANATKHIQRKEVIERRGRRVGYEDIQTQAISVGNGRCNWPINGDRVMIEVEDNNLWLLSDLVEAARTFWVEKFTEKTTHNDSDNLNPAGEFCEGPKSPN